nr:protein ALTERED XYLOGLUCAN 4-like isoform X1 [Quercus suber]
MTCTGMNMKSSSTVFRERIQFGKVERCINMGRRPVHFILSTLFIATIFSIFLLYSPNPLYLISKQGLEQQAPSPMQGHKSHQKRESCDLSKGHWVRESRGSFFYTNSSCATIPESKNCFKQGRMDMDFLNWRWKPDQCDLPRFNAKTSLQILQGKTMAFIGDSVARNHMESLLCLLSQEEIPEDIYKDSEDRFRTWYFRSSNFTLKVLWTKFLIAGEERMINGTGSSIFDLQIDKVDDGWAKHLPGVDYAIVSAGHWFFRVMYLHEGDNVVGCVYCNEPNVTNRNVDFALQMSFRAAFNYINGCKNCSGLVTLLRTFTPAHFENGAWNTGGYCNRTGPFNETEIDLTSSEWQMRNAQVKEIKRARKFGGNQGKRFGVVDVTRAMLMRPDGHPGEHWGNKWKGGYNDCVHWCMPGPVDTWSEIFMAVLRKEAGLSSL